MIHPATGELVETMSCFMHAAFDLVNHLCLEVKWYESAIQWATR